MKYFRTANERIDHFLPLVVPGAVLRIALGHHHVLARIAGVHPSGMLAFDYREGGILYRGHWSRETLAYTTIEVLAELDWLLQEIGA